MDITIKFNPNTNLGVRRVVVGFTTTYAIGAFHHCCCEFGSRSE
jgi:hypothetical protein